MIDQLKSFFYKLFGRSVQQRLQRVLRGKTMGVRVAAFDAQGRVMLVKHSYTPGWSLPGGGVENGEMLLAAAIREIYEEAGIVADEALLLHGVFSNEPIFPGDFVCCYVLRRCHRDGWKPNFEINDAQFFEVEKLPVDITAGSKRRLDEILNGTPISELW